MRLHYEAFAFIFANTIESYLTNLSGEGITIMFVCICNAITDHQIKETVSAGASTLSDLQAQLGVATCCGCCKDLASSFLTAGNNQQNSAVTAGINIGN